MGPRKKSPDEPSYTCDNCKKGFDKLKEYTNHKTDCQCLIRNNEDTDMETTTSIANKDHVNTNSVGKDSGNDKSTDIASDTTIEATKTVSNKSESDNCVKDSKDRNEKEESKKKEKIQ